MSASNILRASELLRRFCCVANILDVITVRRTPQSNYQ